MINNNSFKELTNKVINIQPESKTDGVEIVLSPRSANISAVYSNNYSAYKDLLIPEEKDKLIYHIIKTKNTKYPEKIRNKEQLTEEEMKDFLLSYIHFPKNNTLKNLFRMEGDPRVVEGLYEAYIKNEKYNFPFASFSEKKNSAFIGAKLDFAVNEKDEFMGINIAGLSKYPEEKEFLVFNNEVSIKKFSFNGIEDKNDFAQAIEDLKELSSLANKDITKIKDKDRKFLQKFAIEGEFKVNQEKFIKQEENYKIMVEYFKENY